MDWQGLMMTVVLLLNPLGINGQGNVTNKLPSTTSTTTSTTTATTTLPTTTTESKIDCNCQIEDLDMTIEKNVTKSGLLMCLRNTSPRGSASCHKVCYVLTKETCPSGSCWKIEKGIGIADKANSIIGILGGTIAVLSVVLVASTIAFLRAHSANFALEKSGYEQKKDEVKPCIVPEKELPEPSPEVPKRPVKTFEENGGYVLSKEINSVVPVHIAHMYQENALQHNVRVTLCED